MKRGRPATGHTKEKLSATIDTNLLDATRTFAKAKGEGLSSFVERAIREQLKRELK